MTCHGTNSAGSASRRRGPDRDVISLMASAALAAVQDLVRHDATCMRGMARCARSMRCVVFLCHVGDVSDWVQAGHTMVTGKRSHGGYVQGNANIAYG
jgi:hypothetical protein